MLSILSILQFIAANIKQSPDRFVILDDQHVLDTKTGVKLHLYDDYFKITHAEKVIATKSDFSEEEQQALWSIKKEIANPEVELDKAKNYQAHVKLRRQTLSGLFETPTPVIEIIPPIAEEDTTAYSG